MNSNVVNLQEWRQKRAPEIGTVRPIPPDLINWSTDWDAEPFIPWMVRTTAPENIVLGTRGITFLRPAQGQCIIVFFRDIPAGKEV